MTKPLQLFVVAFMFCTAAFSQQKPQPDSVAYLMINDWETAANQDQASFVRLVTKADSGYFNIQDYYMNSSPRLIAKSSVRDWNYTKGARGIALEYFKNGKRRYVKNYVNGKLVGDVLKYYPSGKLYAIENYDKDSVYLKTCYDTSGRVLANDGKGKWFDYDADFRSYESGPVEAGKKNGVWFRQGISTVLYYDNGFATKLDSDATFVGGQQKMTDYLAKHIRYTQDAYNKKIHGTIIVTFIVETDGSIADVKVVRGIDPVLDQRALEAIQKMPKWVPGMYKGQPVSILHSIPLSFDASTPKPKSLNEFETNSSNNRSY